MGGKPHQSLLEHWMEHVAYNSLFEGIFRLFFSANCEAISDEHKHGKKFYQEILTMEKWYQDKQNATCLQTISKLNSKSSIARDDSLANYTRKWQTKGKWQV